MIKKFSNIVLGPRPKTLDAGWPETGFLVRPAGEVDMKTGTFARITMSLFAFCLLGIHCADSNLPNRFDGCGSQSKPGHRYMHPHTRA